MADWRDPRGSSLPISQERPAVGGVVIRPNPHALESGRADPGLLWGELGLALHDRGWAVIPQTLGTDGRQRQPGGSLEWTARGQSWKMISYKTEHAMHRGMPPRSLVERWTRESSGTGSFQRSNTLLNVAGVPGDSPGSFGWFSVDCDIHDAALMPRLLDGADRIFGRTPFLRGRAKSPKAALFYHRKLGPLRGLAKTITLEALHGDAKQQIEIKDDGSLITLYGYNPSFDPYLWMRDAEPYTTSPEHMPEVDEEQILEWLGFVHSLSPITGFENIQRKARSTPVLYADADVSNLRVPHLYDDQAIPGQTDGRRAWLLNRSKPWTRLNAGLVAPDIDGQRHLNAEGIAKVAAAIIAESEPYIDWNVSSRTLTIHNRRRVVGDMVRATAQKLAEGVPGFEPIGTRRLDPVTLQPEPEIGQGVVQTDDEYSWLTRAKDRKRIGSDDHPTYRRTAPNAEAATAVALVLDRVEIMQRVSSEIRAAIFEWLDALWVYRQAVIAGEKPARVPAHLLKAPTGAGKTTMLLQCLGKWKLAHPGADLGPILMLLPSHQNINEIAGREDLGVWTKDQLDRAGEIVAEANGAGIRAMKYKGKIAAGCHEAERVQALQSAGINASGLCEAEVMMEQEYDGVKTVEPVRQYCRYHPDNPDRGEDVPACKAILQRLEIPESDIVLAPHAFLTTNAPRALKDGIVAVVVDEKIWDKAIGVRVFPVRTFLGMREEPVLTKKEKAENKKAVKQGRLADVIDPLDRWQSRNEVGELIHEAALQREDLATAIVKLGKRNALKEALWTTGRLQRIVMEISPDTSIEAIRAYTKSVKTKHLVDEHKLLTLVKERVDDIGGRALVPVGHPILSKARGKTDARIQLVNDGADLRVSWRKKLNFDDRPFLFLDASGDREILERIWGRDIIVHDVQAPLFVRTVCIPDGSYAKSRILPAKDDGADTIMAKAARQVLLREAMTAAAIAHGDGAVVAASALSVRKHLQAGWHQPANVHFMHYGATRGLDFAKRHSAAFSIGQLELPPLELDAITGALTYDLPEPETPSDPFGNGRIGPLETDEKLTRRIVDREVPLRDGGVATVPVYEPEGKWAKMIVEQVREEELSQFLGRLRPVYRSGRAPTWYHCGRVLPRGVVVDEVVSLEDLARPFGRTSPVLHEMAVGGVLTPTTLGGFHLTGVSDHAIAKAHATVSGSERWQRGLYEIEYTVEGAGDVLRGFVPGWSADPLGSLKSAAYGVADARIVREPRIVKYGLPAQDKVDAEIGSREGRAADYDAAMQLVMMKVERKKLEYDEGRSGIKVGRYAQAPHLVAARELLTARIVEMAAAAAAAEIDALPEETFMLADLEAEAIARMLSRFDDATFEAILDRAGVVTRLDEIRSVRKKLAPVEISFGGGTAPTPANATATLPELPPGVVRLHAFRPFRPAAVVPVTHGVGSS